MRTALLLLALSLHLPLAAAPARHPDVDRVVAVSDVHGAYNELLAILQRAGILDEAAHWRGGAAHLVVAGDMLDRGAESRRVLELLMRVEDEARAAGGATHVLLGNHEAMNLVGDLDDAHPGEFAAFAAEEDAAERAARRAEFLGRRPEAERSAAAKEFERRFPPGWFAHRRAFAPEGRYGRWLLARPAVVVVRDTLFVHGGLSTLSLDTDLAGINTAIQDGLRQYLEAAALLERAGWFGFDADPGQRVQAGLQRARTAGVDATERAAFERLLAWHRSPWFDLEGPLWYRGLAICHPQSVTDPLDRVLAHHRVARIAIGHTVASGTRTTSRHGGRVLLMDTGMQRAVYRGDPAAMVLDATGPHALYLDGERPIVEDPRAVGFRAFPASDGERERLLREAPARISDRRSSTRYTVALGAVEPARAAWLYLDRDATRGGSGAFRNELAAYRLDRLLGLYLVPTTVEREVDGVRGALQWADPRAVDAASEAAARPTTTPWCNVGAQRRLLGLLDALTGLEARTPGSLVFDSADWVLLAGDHRLAFTNRRGLPPNAADLHPAPTLCRRLAALDRPTVTQRLGDLLDGAQLTALLARRDRLVKAARAAGVSCEALPSGAGS